MRPLACLSRVPPSLAVILVLALSGCRREADTAQLPGIGAGAGHVEWRGTTPCADCSAVVVRLLLERGRDRQRYVLEETYVAGDGGARFVERGRWRQAGGLLRLEGDGGSRRTFALRPDGSLRARDSHGRALAVQDGAVLSPLPPSP